MTCPRCNTRLRRELVLPLPCGVLVVLPQGVGEAPIDGVEVGLGESPADGVEVGVAEELADGVELGLGEEFGDGVDEPGVMFLAL